MKIGTLELQMDKVARAEFSYSCEAAVICNEIVMIWHPHNWKRFGLSRDKRYAWKVRVIRYPWLRPLKGVVIPKAKVRPQKKTTIATQRRIKDSICIRTGNYVLPITYDSTN